MAQENNASQQLYDLLVTRDFDPKSLDAMGKPTVNPNEADLFSFNFKTENKEYGTVVVLVNGDNDLEVFYGDNLGKAMDSGDKGDWYDFLAAIRNLAKRHLLTFSLNNMNKLKYQMKSMADLAEGLVLEAWKGQGKNKSYNNQPGNAKVVIQHSRAIGEGEQRFRNIGALFVENAQGERFKMPFESIAGAKAMARHVSEGGNPYDSFGQHISEMVNEINTLGKFIRASRGNQFAQNTDALGIVEDAVKHYADLKRKAKKIIGRRGYKEIFSGYNPMEVTELDETIERVREVFVNSAVDSRIEEALPILAKIKENTMREADIFEQWADRLTEGTWQLPSESEETFAKFTELMAQPLKAGPGGEYASEVLYDIFGDDTLFDEIGELGDRDPEADVRDLIRARAEELEVVMPEEAEAAPTEVDVEVGESIVENPTEEEPASEYQAGQARAAKGKADSLGMNMGGDDAAAIKTAGGDDIEEDNQLSRIKALAFGIEEDTNEGNEFSGALDETKILDNMSQLPKGIEKPLKSMQSVKKDADLGGMKITHIVKNKQGNKVVAAVVSNGKTNFIYVNNNGVTPLKEENYQGGGDKVMFKGREIDTDTIDYDMEDFSDLIFNIDYGVKYTDGSLVDEEDYDALTYADDIMDFVRIDYVESFREGVDNFVNPNDQANKISNSEKEDLDSEDMTEDNDMENLLRLAGQVNEAKSPPEVINPTKDSSPADLKAAIKYAQYMKAKMDKPVAKKSYDKEIAQLQGWMKAKSVMKETQDIDTGEEVVKAERDPALTNEALERILKLSKW